MNDKLTKWIADYDNGKAMESVSMGGISEGYERAIQECAIEIMRNLKDTELPPEDDVQTFRNHLSLAEDKAVKTLYAKHGFSGAQVGAAKNMASVFWRQTPEKGLDMMRTKDAERIITIQKGQDDNLAFVGGYKNGN